MGWSDGTGLFGELAYILRKEVSDKDSRKEVYEHMIDAFVDVGWDGSFEDLLGSDPVLDEVCHERDPDLSEEDDFIEDDE